jgi:predicted DCC family thiol-disulfide oxidoreductase YuxK
MESRAQDVAAAAVRDGRLEVYTDGRCPMCRWSREHVEPLDTEHRLEWLDYHDPEALRRAAPLTHRQLAEAMHVRLPGGGWRTGYWAWLEVLRVLPRWRWLTRLLSLWPFTRLGPVFYDQLAKRRYKLFGIPPPCDDAGVCSLHEKKG